MLRDTHGAGSKAQAQLDRGKQQSWGSAHGGRRLSRLQQDLVQASGYQARARLAP